MPRGWFGAIWIAGTTAAQTFGEPDGTTDRNDDNGGQPDRMRPRESAMACALNVGIIPCFEHVLIGSHDRRIRQRILVADRRRHSGADHNALFREVAEFYVAIENHQVRDGVRVGHVEIGSNYAGDSGWRANLKAGAGFGEVNYFRTHFAECDVNLGLLL